MWNKQKVLGNLSRGLLFVVSAPAGTGKTTLARLLTKEFPCVKMAISFTTRTPRPGEENGVDYFFISNDEFDKKLANGEFLEHVELFGARYATSKALIQKLQDDGMHVILVIDTQGAEQLKGKMEASYIFLMPPSHDELEKRLISRGSEKGNRVKERLLWSKKEIEQAKFYDYIIINDELSCAYEALKSILIAEEHKAKNFINIH